MPNEMGRLKSQHRSTGKVQGRTEFIGKQP